MMKKLALVYNPKAGKEAFVTNKDAVCEIFHRNGYEVLEYPTAGPKDATRIAAELPEDVDILVAAGGDGTLNEVVNGLKKIDFRVPLGYIACGSTCDFAHTLDLPRDPFKAAERICEGQEKRIDLGELNGVIFDYVAAFGMFTDVAYKTDHALKEKMGYSAYLLTALKEIFSIPHINMKVTTPERSWEQTYSFGMVTNSNYVAGMKMHEREDVGLDDGLFEVTLVKGADTIFSVIGVLLALNNHKEHALVERFRTSHIAIESDSPIVWTLDGEDGHEVKRSELFVKEKMLRILL